MTNNVQGNGKSSRKHGNTADMGSELFADQKLILKGTDYPFFLNVKTGKKRYWSDLNAEEQEAVHQQGYYIDVWDEGEAVIRKMNSGESETYHSAIVQASYQAKYFRDMLALLRPFADRTARTAYIDESARVGLGDLFFYHYSKEQQVAAILHEACHVLFRHFPRARDISGDMNSMMNIAQDFEINCGLRKIEKIDTSPFVHPDDRHKLDEDHPSYRELNGKRIWPEGCEPHMTFEQHYSILRELADENKDPNCPVHGEEGESSDNSSEESGQGSGQPESDDADKSESDDDGAENDSSDSDDDSEGKPDDSSGDDSEGNDDSDGSGSGASASDESGGDDSSEAGQGQGECSCQPEGCADVTPEREQEADDAGIDKASDVEKDSAIRNTQERIIEEQKRNTGYGTGAGNDFLKYALEKLEPPKAPWQAILRNLTVHNTNKPVRGRGNYTYKRANRRMASYRDWRTGQRFIFPGSVTFTPNVMLGIDTSGSMRGEDFRPTLNEVEGVIKSIPRAAHGLSVFNVDTEISSVQQVRSVHDIDLTGGGGTRMSKAFEYVNSLPGEEKPDLMILATDGGLAPRDWTDIYQLVTAPEAFYKAIILVTQERAMRNVPEQLKQVAYVLDISDD